MAAVRAIENGCNLVRDVSNGRSFAVDYLGRTLAEADFFASGGHDDIVAYVPASGARTIYSRIGDLFGWLCVAALAAFVGLEMRRPAA
jgi:apolipoprotein N-acyltransferase